MTGELSAAEVVEAALEFSDPPPPLFIPVPLTAPGLVAWEWDLRTHELLFSTNAQAALGISPALLRRPECFWSRVDPQDRAAHRARLDRALARREPYVSEFRWTRPDDGRVIWLEDRGGVVDDGRRLVAAGVLAEITERKAAEAEREEIRRRAEVLLAAQREEQQTILDSVRPMIWYKDKANRILRCNKAAAQSLGLRVEDVQGRSCEELYPEEAEAYHQDDLDVINSGRPKLGIVEPLLNFDGTKRWIQTDKIPFRDEKGEVVGVIVFAMDITERKQAEDVLRESDQQQRDFVANVSHEFRTPVAAIKGFAETLRRGKVDARSRERFVRIIENHANRLQWLIEDLLTLSSLESGVEKLVLEPVELSEFVTEYARSVEPVARRAGVDVRVRVPRGLLVNADQSHFLQALENLIGNAIKYNRRGGWVRVTASRRGPLVHLCVKDNGIGIAPSHLPRIFDRFYRVNKGAASGATGLGLHIVKKIVEAHGGRIWAESRLGSGTTFTVALPAAPRKR